MGTEIVLNDVEVFELELLQGKTIKAIVTDRNYFIMFVTTEKEVILMYHDQDCCETVYLDDIVGDLLNLIDVPDIVKLSTKAMMYTLDNRK